MKSLLVETKLFNIPSMALTEGKGPNGNPLVEGILATCEVKNGNGRYYSKDLWEREIDKYMNLVKERRACGELDHPDSSIISLSNISHLITKIWWEGNDVMGELTLLDTPSGKIAQEIIRCGIPLGISSRGMGSVKQIGETVEVQDDFELLCWDLVSVPSTPNAYMTLSESKQYKSTKDYSKVNSLITEIICSQTGVCVFCP